VPLSSINPLADLLGCASTSTCNLDLTLGEASGDLLSSATLGDLLAALAATQQPTLGDLRLDLASGPEVQSLVLEAMVAHLSTDILDTLRLGDIGTYVTITGQDITLGDLGVWTRADGTEITLGDIAAYLPASISLADVLFGLVPASAFPYEDY